MLYEAPFQGVASFWRLCTIYNLTRLHFSCITNTTSTTQKKHHVRTHLRSLQLSPPGRGPPPQMATPRENPPSSRIDSSPCSNACSSPRSRLSRSGTQSKRIQRYNSPSVFTRLALIKVSQSYLHLAVFVLPRAFRLTDEANSERTLVTHVWNMDVHGIGTTALCGVQHHEPGGL